MISLSSMMPGITSGLLGQVTLRVIPAAFLILLLIWFSVGLVSDRVFQAEINAKLEHQAESQAFVARTRLQSLVSTVEGLAHNDLIINGLIDVNAETNYLKPFLRSIAIEGHADGPILLTDYRGRPISGRDIEVWQDADLSRWSEEVGPDRPVVELGDNGLNVAAPVLIGGLVEGMLVAQISPDLLRLLLRPSIEGGRIKLVHAGAENSEPSAATTSAPELTMVQADLSMGWSAGQDLKLISTVYAGENDRSSASFQWFMFVAFVIDLIALCCGIFAAVYLVLKPLKRFIAHLDQPRKGEGFRPFDDEDGPAEIQSLTRAFNRFAEAERALIRERSEQAAQTAKALDREKELNRLQRQFVAMVCHEFRTPLAIIDGSASNLIRNHENVPPDRVKERLNKVRKAVGRLTDLIESVLSAARLEAGTIKFDAAPTDLKEAIMEVVGSHREASPEMEIVADVDGLPGRWVCDPKLLRQVVSNLISNAIKYSPNDTHVWIDARSDENGVIVAVRDEGPGIPADELSQLFDRFFRASTSIGIAGTGIGLHIVKSFVDLHGGHVEVASEEGQGTTFSMYLPNLTEQGCKRESPKTIAA